MAEIDEDPELEVPTSELTGASAAASFAVGMKRGKSKPGADPQLDAFIEEQTLLARLQMEHLHEQRQLVLSRLRWGRFSDRMKAALQVMTALVGLAIFAVIAVVAWQAHEARGLVIDAFSVPQDMTRDGLTGQVAASRFLDKLQALQAGSANSDRPAQSFQNSWGSDVKVEIPETGLTFGEFEKLLRERLGHISHVSGEVLRTPTGISLTARIGDDPPETFTGAATDFDALAQKAAEAVFRRSQPYRFAEYLDGQGRVDEAYAVISDLAVNGPVGERGWAYGFWALMDVNDRGDLASARQHFARGMGFGAGSDMEDRISTVNAAVWAGDEETNLRLSRVIAIESQKRQPDTSPLFFSENRLLGTAWVLFITPDYPASAAAWLKTAGVESKWTDSPLSTGMAATAWALAHDPAAARAVMAKASIVDETTFMPKVATGAFPALPIYWVAVEDGSWPAALADAKHVDEWLEANKAKKPVYGLLRQVWILPLEALAQARSRDVAGAQALIGKTPLDCYLCLRVRGQIAAEARDWPTADRWFAEAVRQAPSPPYAYTEWGQMLLAKGDPDGAIAKLTLAQAKAPRFADPLELWGEALTKKGDFKGAAAKFREAAKLAPSWARNQQMLKQAEAHG